MLPPGTKPTGRVPPDTAAWGPDESRSGEMPLALRDTADSTGLSGEGPLDPTGSSPEPAGEVEGVA